MQINIIDKNDIIENKEEEKENFGTRSFKDLEEIIINLENTEDEEKIKEVLEWKYSGLEANKDE